MDKLKLKPEIVCLKLSNNCLHSFSAKEVKDSILTRYTFLNSKHFSITSLDNSINLLISSRCSFSIKVKSKVDNVDEINYYIKQTGDYNLSVRKLREKIKSKEYQR